MTVPPAPGPSARALVPTRLGWDAAVIAVVGLTLALAWLADPPQPAGGLLLLAGIGLLVGAYLGFFRLWRPVPAARAEAGGTAGAQSESAPRMWGFVAAAMRVSRGLVPPITAPIAEFARAASRCSSSEAPSSNLAINVASISTCAISSVPMSRSMSRYLAGPRQFHPWKR